MMREAVDQVGLQLIICQSEDDVGVLKASGFRSVKPLPNAESVFIPGSDTIDPSMDVFSKFILVPRHGDDVWLEQVAIRIGDLRCRWVSKPDGFVNLQAMFSEHGPGVVHAFVSNAKPMWSDELCVMSDIPESLGVRTFETGFKLLDQHGLRLPKSGLVTVIGPYGSGKSVWLRQLACNMYKLHDWRTCVTAFEEKVRPRMERDLAWYLGEKRFSFGTDQIEPATLKKIDEAFVFLRRKRNTSLDLNRLLNRLEYAISVYGCDAFIIDPVNEVDHAVPKGMNKSDYMAEFLMSLKRLADDYSVLAIVAAHPPKETTGTRRKSIYTLNDGADTAHYGNKSDIGICIWRQDPNSPTYLNYDKSKDHDEFGKPTLAKMVLRQGGIGFDVVDIGEPVLAEIVG